MRSMRLFGNFVLASVVLVLAACSSTGSYPPGAASTAPKKSVKFPTRLGVFTQSGGLTYDFRGDPTAKYYAGAMIVLDAYYYPDDPNFTQHYADCKDAILTYNPKARLISEKASSLRPRGRQSLYEFTSTFLGSENVRLRSELFLFIEDNQYLKFRATYRKSHAERAHREVAQFVRQFTLK